MLSNEELGFVLVCCAGASTCIGAAVVYNASLVKLASHKVLGAALALSGGVMLYVSLVEILVKAQSAFEDAGANESDAYLFATLSFFGGFVAMLLIDRLVHYIDKNADDHIVCLQTGHCTEEPSISLTPALKPTSAAIGSTRTPSFDMTNCGIEEPTIPPRNVVTSLNIKTRPEKFVDGKELKESGVSSDDSSEHEKKRLSRTGLLTAVAIGIHNFPEGLATFVATLHDPTVGVALAIAIAIHNVPEGLCVSMPVYFATGDRHKAFWWATLSGVSEPIGALIGWLVLNNAMDGMVYGSLFGVVAGMMVNIVLHEILPTAHRYDPKNEVVTNFTLLGMAIMALSLCLFMY